MASFEFPDMPKTPMSPQMLVGAASPLWAYFGAAAAGGVAYWWMTRWARPVNLEALFGAAAQASPLAAVAAAEEALGAAAEAAIDAAESVLEAPAPLGGESAPLSPAAAAAAPAALAQDARDAVADHAMVREDKPGGEIKEAVEAATAPSSDDASSEGKPKARKAAAAKTDS